LSVYSFERMDAFFSTKNKGQVLQHKIKG